ncbi:hypothetical protein PA598K_02363 [Paenibacillus sp. 598K]|uniref:hypothetical protein n=1 Tax=Paenibacillus sp. 598K TaxID=1117987 RepID=UPI000FFAAAEB|nr:hypothetical protein [Paenibacillus sp. 598K]GBF74033.1 hypothetical protein PA598K_02363 [Paenibacillus sp. 598K]
MNTSVKIPQGDEKVTVELTVKELMALAGARFHGNHTLEIGARKKLKDALADTYNIDSSKKDSIDYQLLN